ncbi:hypothetical protein RJ639_026166 [Escallonia herrerae]|uniref:Protein kinase domain-containing protein n=1 Tax=Escallonia herrerae TaxID=1293975 RepID=A0AA88RU36_9ASTE|nr:hypothetical protein RJ639_026166 [Escallonia herrerae]
MLVDGGTCGGCVWCGRWKQIAVDRAYWLQSLVVKVGTIWNVRERKGAGDGIERGGGGWVPVWWRWFFMAGVVGGLPYGFVSVAGIGEKRSRAIYFRVFSLTELRRATGNFASNMVVGEGASGIVFKGWVHENTYAPSQVGVGMAVAVKILNLNGRVGPKEAKVKFMGKFSHPNLVKLLGYCLEDKDFLLVSEYVQKGSLEHHLFNHNADLLPWITRLNIVRGAVRGLSFLHRTKGASYSPTSGPSIFTTLTEGDNGYINFPRKDVGYIMVYHGVPLVLNWFGLIMYHDDDIGKSWKLTTLNLAGHLTVKSDIYGFGAVLLEILTGLRVFDVDRPGEELDLVRYVKPFLSGKRNLRSILDRRLEHECPLEDEVLLAVAALALKCLEDYPRNRPGVEEVLETLEQIHVIQTKSMNSTAQHLTLQSQA